MGIYGKKKEGWIGDQGLWKKSVYFTAFLKALDNEECQGKKRGAFLHSRDPDLCLALSWVRLTWA